MKISKDALNFNKEILFGEIGAMLGAPFFSYIFSKFSLSANTFATLTVVGVMISASVFWLFMRIYDKTRNGRIEKKKFIEDLAYLTPVASLLAFLIYYPTLFLLSRYFFENNYRVVSSAIFSQMTAFGFFLFSINMYRYLLLKLTGKKL